VPGAKPKVAREEVTDSGSVRRHLTAVKLGFCFLIKNKRVQQEIKRISKPVLWKSMFINPGYCRRRNPYAVEF
jgi:hypothetical protein